MSNYRVDPSPSHVHTQTSWLDEKTWVPSSVPRVMKSLAACVRLCSRRVSYKSSASERPLTALRASALIGWDRERAGDSAVPVWPPGVHADIWNQTRRATETPNPRARYTKPTTSPWCTSMCGDARKRSHADSRRSTARCFLTRTFIDRASRRRRT